MERQSKSNQPKLVLFDIDGTLIAGRYPPAIGRFYHVFKKYLGHEAVINWKKFDGTTDKLIFKKILKNQGMKEEKINEKMEKFFEEAYQYFVKNIGSDYKKRLIKETSDLVKKLHHQKNIYLGLLTGNEEMVARLKVNIVGLGDYFRFGLFGNEAEYRTRLAKLVFKKAKKVLGIDFLKENIYIIGDTPNDIKCGKFIKAKTIGVASGRFSLSELKKSKPDLAVKSLSNKKVWGFILK